MDYSTKGFWAGAYVTADVNVVSGFRLIAREAVIKERMQTIR